MQTAGRAFRSRARLLVVASLTAAGVFAFTSQVFGSFGTAVNFAANSKPIEAAIGDLDGDGHLDIAVANYGANGVTVLLGNGDATLTAPAFYGVGNTTYSVAIGELTGDDIPDLAAANYGSSQVMVFAGTGDGTFDAGTNYPVGSFPTSVAIGDLNGDTRPDLVTANQGSTNVSILLSDESGSFDAATALEVGITGPRSVALGNLNGDSFLDIAVVTPLTTMIGDEELSKGSVLLGNGDGTFGAPTDFTAGKNSAGVAIGDFNADGKRDLAVANVNSNNVSVLLGTGTGSFGAATSFPAGQNPQSVTVGDLDGDGHLDLVVPNKNNVGVLEGNGDGSFGDAAFFAAGSFPSSAVIGNLDEDDNPDLGVANFVSNDVSILRNEAATATASPTDISFGDQAEGSTSAPQAITITNAVGGDPMDVTAVSVSGTNAADFAVTSETCSTEPVPLAGTCEAQVTFTPSAVGGRAATLEVTYDGGASPLTVPLSGTGMPTCPESTIGTPPDCVALKARIGKLTVTGPSALKKGKAATYRAKITNSGNAAATGVRLVVSGRGIRLSSPVGRINAGATRTVKLRVRPSRTGRIKATFKATSGNAGSRTVRKTVRVR